MATAEDERRYGEEQRAKAAHDAEMAKRPPPGVVDRSAYNFGGDPNAANNLAGKIQGNADAAQGRQGEQINTQNADGSRNNALASRELALGARNGQMGMADLMARRARGQTPSIAGMVANRDMGRVAAAQSSAQASARGPAGMALAQQGAAANTAGAQSAISNQAQINSANERLQAEQAAFGAMSGIRGGDQSQQGADLSMQGQDFNQAHAQAQLNAQQRQANDAFTLGNQAQGIGVQGMQMGGQMNRDQQEQAGHFNAAGLQEQKNAANDANTLGWVGTGASLAATAAQFAASDERTKVPVTWGGEPNTPDTGPGGSVSDSGLGLLQGQQTWGKPPEAASGVDMSKMIARRALDEQTERDTARSAADAQMGGGGGQMMAMSNAGMGALRQRDDEDRALIASKQRNGAALSHKEEASKASLAHRARMEQTSDVKPLDAKKASTGEQAGSAAAQGLGSIGKAISGMAKDRRPDTAWRYTPAAPHAMPQMTTSDDHAKVAVAQRDAFKAGMNHANEAATTGEFGKPPAYMAQEEAPKWNDSTRQQPKNETGRPAVRGRSTVERADRSTQDRLNAESEENLRNANEAKTLPIGIGGVLGGMAVQGNEAKFQESRSTSGKAPESSTLGDYAQRIRTTMFSDERAKKAEDMLANMKSQGQAQLDAGPSVGGKSTLDSRAREMIESMKGNEAQLREGPSVGNLGPEVPEAELAEAARSMRSPAYAYKPEFAGNEGQAPGEINVGPVAQEMQESDVARTAVKEGPDGIRQIDIPKFTKVLGAVAAGHQKKLDEQEAQISFMARRLGGFGR